MTAINRPIIVVAIELRSLLSGRAHRGTRPVPSGFDPVHNDQHIGWTNHPGMIAQCGGAPRHLDGQADVDLIAELIDERLRTAESDHEEHYGEADAGRKEPVSRGTGNVFAYLGFPDAAERQATLRLASALNQVLDGCKLSQADAAKLLGVTQPKVSALRHYKLAGFSVERLMNLLTALDQDVEILIRRKPRSRKVAQIRVIAAYDLQMALKPKATPRQRRLFTSAKR